MQLSTEDAWLPHMTDAIIDSNVLTSGSLVATSLDRLAFSIILDRVGGRGGRGASGALSSIRGEHSVSSLS